MGRRWRYTEIKLENLGAYSWKRARVQSISGYDKNVSLWLTVWFQLDLVLIKMPQQIF